MIFSKRSNDRFRKGKKKETEGKAEIMLGGSGGKGNYELKLSELRRSCSEVSRVKGGKFRKTLY